MTDDPGSAERVYTPPLPREVFVRVATAIYGPDFVSPLAADLGVERRTVGRWKSGYSRITPLIGPRLLAMLQARRGELAELAADTIAAEAALLEALAPA